MKISAIIITRNEKENIKDCIGNLSFAEEVVVVDNDSKDKTVLIAKLQGARVIKVKGLDFAKLRNMGKEKALYQWLFYIDADEKVTRELRGEILEKVKKPNNYSAFFLTRKNFYLGKAWPKKEKIIRLIKKKSLLKWQGKLHESPQIEGKVGSLSAPLLHYTHRNLTDMVDKTNQWSEIEAQLRFEANHPPVVLWRLTRVWLSTFFSYYIKEGGWKVGTVGLIESIYQAFSMFITYVKLWEKQNKQITDSK